MQYFKGKLYPASVQRKVIAGFLLVFIAILLALGLTRFGFREMMDTVDQLSAPNKELNALNDIFQEITALDQLQRAEAIKNPKNPYKAFLNQSKSLVNKIDSLRMMQWDSAQQNRLLVIKGILQKRNRLFFSYLKLKSDLIDNRSLTIRLDTLSRILVNEKVAYDTSVVTTEKKTITTYTKDSVGENQKDRSRIGKLFSKKKKVTPQTTHIKVQEELSVVVDTLSIARQNKALQEVEKIILDLENDQRAENKKLLHEELELIHANSLLINQLLSILHEVENEELAKLHQNNDRAVALVTQSILRISILLVVFFICAALLVYLIWVDISRSNYYKKQLEKAKDQAEELSLIKQRFLANMSHEIRTPLQSIIGFAEQLKLQGSNDEAVSAINSSSEHLLHIVDEVLDYSRISSGSFALNKENFPLLSLVKEVESALRVQAESKGLSLLLDLEHADDFNLHGDPFRLRQILYNLLGNAIKFTANGYVKLGLKTKVEKDHVQCVFEISDTGIGMRPEDLTRIFNQFEQANSLIARHYGGTGLGLTIAKSLVEAQGGALDVTSDPGHGSTFSVTLRFEKAHEAGPQTFADDKNATTPFTGKVIVVDDDVMILRLCSLILEKNDIRFVTYNDAKKLINENPDPEVTHILMDIRMPDINGVELCHELHKKYNAATRFVALTAHVFPQEQQQLLKEGFDAVLSKPFRELEILNLFGISSIDRSIRAPESTDFDLSTLRLMTLGDETLFQSIITQFIEETENDLHQLDENLKFMNAGPIREIVHKLGGRIGQMGVLSLSARLRDIETKLVDGVALSSLVEKIMSAKDEAERLLRTIRIRTMAQSS